MSKIQKIEWITCISIVITFQKVSIVHKTNQKITNQAAAQYQQC